MSRISERLKTIHQRLDLPQPARSRVLLEIAGDLESLKEHYLHKGHGEEEAEQQALEMCDLSEEAVAQLVKVHAGGYRRFLERFSAQARTRWERGLLAVILVCIVYTFAGMIGSGRLLAHAGNMVWPIMGFTFLAIVLLLPKYYAVYLKQNHNAKQLRAGLNLIPGIAGVNLLVGFYGFWLGLYPLARRAMDDFEQALPSVTEWLLTGSAMQMLCLVSVILTLVLWFIIHNRVSRIEEAEAAVLLAEETKNGL